MRSIISAHRSRQHRPPKIEQLEHRRLLAANNVTLAVDETLTARLVGDKKNNDIVITIAPGVGYYVSGQNGTLINGKPTVAIQTTAALNFDVRTAAGKDRVTFTGVFATQNILIDTGKDKDTVILSQTTHFGNVSILTDKGEDSVELSAIRVTGNLNVATGNDKDAVALLDTVQVEGSSIIDGGKGKNTLSGQESLQVGGASSILGMSAAEQKKPKKQKAKENDD